MKHEQYHASRSEIGRIVGGFAVAAGGVSLILTEAVVGWQSKTLAVGSMIALGQGIPPLERMAGMEPSFPTLRPTADLE